MKIYRIFIILFSILLIAFFINIIANGFHFELISITNGLFVAGIISFFPVLISLTNAMKLFDGLRYSVRVLFDSQYRKKYPSFRDYKTDHDKEKSDSKIFLEILLVSSFVLLVSIILTVIYHAKWKENEKIIH